MKETMIDEEEDDVKCNIVDKMCEDECVIVDVSDMVIAWMNNDEIKFILDTGCRKLHKCSTPVALQNLRRTTAKVIGMEGTPMTPDGIGDLPLVGPSLLVPNAGANLVSVPAIVDLLMKWIHEMRFQCTCGGTSHSHLVPSVRIRVFPRLA